VEHAGFLTFAFQDETYLAWERDYKWATHKRWVAALRASEFGALLRAGEYREIAARAVRVEQQSRHSMIFSSRRWHCAMRCDLPMGRLQEDVRARLCDESEHGNKWPGQDSRLLARQRGDRFDPCTQPVLRTAGTVTITRVAAEAYGFDFTYASRPNWGTYRSLLGFARQIRSDIQDLGPRDMIDIQSFMWVLGSTEYD
jgi:hypothetical protein